jgi:hypothetical protein
VVINAGFALSADAAPTTSAPFGPVGSELNVNGTVAPDQRALSAYRGTLGNSSWVSELDRMRESVDNSIKVQSVMVGSSVAVTGTLSVGYVIWLLRGGLLVSSLLSSLPAWHAIDPLPVLGRTDQDEEEGAEEADPLERLFGKAKEAIGLKPGSPPRAADTPVPAQAAAV